MSRPTWTPAEAPLRPEIHSLRETWLLMTWQEQPQPARRRSLRPLAVFAVADLVLWAFVLGGAETVAYWIIRAAGLALL
jgi:hypothetical protein